MNTPYPKSKKLSLTFSSGASVELSTFTALQVLEDDRITDAFVDIYETAQRLGREASERFIAKVRAAGLTLEAVQALDPLEAQASGFVVEYPTTAKVVAACRKPLSKLVRAALSDKDDAFFAELGIDDLMTLIAAVYSVNVERYEGKLQESLEAVTKALRGSSAIRA